MGRVRRARLACLLTALLAVALLALPPVQAAPRKGAAKPAESPKARELKQQIEAERDKAQEARQEVKRLQEREKSVAGEVAGTDRRLGQLERAVKERESRLAQIEAKGRSQEGRLKDLTASREKSVAELKRLLGQLWPVHAGGLSDRLAGLENWAEADRRFVWLSAVYEKAQRKLAEIKTRSQEVERSLEGLEDTRREAEAGLAEVNAAKDELLAGKLKLLRSLGEVRAQKQEAREGLDDILGAIASLDYKLKTLPPPPRPAPRPAPAPGKPAAPAPERPAETEVVVPRFSGKLPWPARGRIVETFSPGASPPRRGLGLALPAGATVNAVEFGRVVHNDRLRGFGQVVILLHQNNAYSLYAFLAESGVRVGQQVQQGQAVGHAGFYPEAQGPGLYFELRLGQKPVNPADWLGE